MHFDSIKAEFDLKQSLFLKPLINNNLLKPHMVAKLITQTKFYRD